MLDNHNEMLKSNYEAVKKNIKAACERSRRDKSEVCLIAVSKTKPQEDIWMWWTPVWRELCSGNGR